jgi:hypothetical protein
MTLNMHERAGARADLPRRPKPEGEGWLRTTGRRAFSALALAFLVILLAAPPGGAQGQERVPSTLWRQYPLDPTKGETTKEPSASTKAGPSEPGPAARPQPRRAQGASADRNSEGGEFPWLLVAGAAGVVLLLEVLLVGFRVAGLTWVARALRPGVLSRRRGAGGGHGPAARRSAPLRRRPGRPRPGDRLSSVASAQSASLRPHAEPDSQLPMAAASPRAEPAEGGAEPKPLKPQPEAGAPSASKPLPGTSPPPGEDQRFPWSVPSAQIHDHAGVAETKPDVRPALQPGSTATDPEAGAGPGGWRTERRPSPRGTGVELGEAAPAPMPGGSARLEHCQIVWWRGYVMSDFYALAEKADGRTEIVARSRSFRWHQSEPPPERGSAAEAHAGLLDALAESGWERLSGATHAWYAVRLQRPRPIPLRELREQLSAGRQG